ncbi:hypothetical protein JCM6882_008333 [Rhodosporidiobolus microsporus]
MASNGSATQTGDCAVCYQPAKLRCSSCAPLGIDLYFCSTDHQKLVWPVHKKVCGAKSGGCVPLLHPPLSEEEAKEAKRDLHKQGIPGGRPPGYMGPTTLWEGFSASGLLLEDVPDVIDSFTKPREEWSIPPLTNFLMLPPHHFVRTIRSYRRQNSTGTPIFEPFALLSGFFTDFASTAKSDGLMLDPYEETWYCTIGHRVLLFCAAVEKKHDELGDGRPFNRYLWTAYEGWSKSLRTYARKMRPTLADYFEYPMTNVLEAMMGAGLDSF